MISQKNPQNKFNRVHHLQKIEVYFELLGRSISKIQIGYLYKGNSNNKIELQVSYYDHRLSYVYIYKLVRHLDLLLEVFQGLHGECMNFGVD